MKLAESQTLHQNNICDFNMAKNKLRLVQKKTPKNKAKLTLLLVHNFDHKLAHWNKIFKTYFTIKTAKNGVEALKIVLDEKIDLVLSSSELGGASGLDVCKFVKQHKTTEHIQVILVSEHYSELEEEKALSFGAIDYISSETRDKILFKRVKNHMKLLKRSKDFEYVSQTDALTGIANRMSFDTRLEQEWQASIRGENSIALIMVDIDHFKLYNDEFGHVEGDKCLTLVAQNLAQNNKRAKDFVARYGGEEFVILLPFTDLAGAENIAQSIVDSVQKLAIPHSPKAHHSTVTISAGVTAYEPSYKNTADSSAAEFLNRADIKLYQAKKFGRNQFCS